MDTDKLPPGYYKDEDGIIYLTVDPYDGVIEEARKDIIKASYIRECFAKGEFDKIKPLVPEECWEPLIKEYNKYIERKKRIKERFERIIRSKNKESFKNIHERIQNRNNNIDLQQRPQIRPPRSMQKCATINNLNNEN